MKLHTNKDGTVAVQTNDGSCIAEGANFLEAMLECGELAEEAAKRKAVKK